MSGALPEWSALPSGGGASGGGSDTSTSLALWFVFAYGLRYCAGQTIVAIPCARDGKETGGA